MNVKKQLLILASATLVFFSSCKKDIVEDNTIQATVSDDATANDVVETSPAIHTPVTTYVNGNCNGFLQSVPARYSLTTKAYPLIVFLHGVGELGNGTVTRVNCCGLPSVLNKRQFPPNFNVNGVNHSFIVMSPQFKSPASGADVQSVIAYAQKRFRIDASRIYVTGMSLGGTSAWSYATTYGQTAAAIVPVVGGLWPNATTAKTLASKNTPVWGIASWGDAVVSASLTVNWINQIKSFNPGMSSAYKLTVYSNLSHNSSWATAYLPTSKVDGRSIYQWMLLWRRGGVAPAPTPAPTPTPKPTPTPTPNPTPTTGNKNPIANAGPDQVVPVSWNYLRLNANFSRDLDGYIKAISWTKVSGGNASLVTPNTGETMVRYLQAGVYVFRAKVTDNRNAVTYDDVKVTMLAK